jgi:hypothetical protein
MKTFAQEKTESLRTVKSSSNNRVFQSPRPVFDPSAYSPSSLVRTTSCPCGGGCSACQGKSGDITASKTLSGVTSPQKIAAHLAPCPAEKVPPIVHNVLQSPGERLDSRTQTALGPKFDLDLGEVKIHTGSAAAQSAKSVNAAALTVGKNIVFGEGRSEDRSLMEHELGHVKEQWSSSEPVLQCRKDPTTVLQDSEVATMNEQMEEIRRWIAAGSLNRTQMRVIISHLSRWYEKDSALGGNTPYLDKFLFLLQTNTATEHHGIGETFGYNEIRLISDALWHDLDDEFLQQYKELAAKSKSQKTIGPNFARGAGALKTIAKQEAVGMTAAVKGLSTGLAGVAGRGAAEYVGKNFDELGELMFDKEWSNGESLFLGLSAKDIGEFGGGVIWDLVMMSKGGAVNTIDKNQKGMAKVNAAQSIVLSVRDIDSILTRLGTSGFLPIPISKKPPCRLPVRFLRRSAKIRLKARRSALFSRAAKRLRSRASWCLPTKKKERAPNRKKRSGRRFSNISSRWWGCCDRATSLPNIRKRLRSKQRR